VKKLLLLAMLPFSALAANTATLTWTSVTTDVNGNPLGNTCTYNVYEGISATALVKSQTGITALTYTYSTGLSGGTTYYFSVSCTAGGVEGAQSNVASKTFPAATPGTPTLTVN